MREIFARAKNAPLHLEARFHGSHWKRDRFSTFEKELLLHISHICHLGINSKTGHVSHLLKLLGGLTSSPAPTLEHLSLSHDGQFQVYIPDTLFDSTTPRLSSLELRNCRISWKTPLLNGLRCLELRTPNTRPSIADWLDALNEMPQLERLVLHSASPIAPLFPFDVERAVTLPFLTHMDISGPARDCALPLAHLVLPAITWLSLTASCDNPDQDYTLKLLSCVARHAHRPQEDRPLQSMLICGKWTRCTHILAWPAPDAYDFDVDGPTALHAARPTARLALTVVHKNGDRLDAYINAAMAALPLNSLVTFALHNKWMDVPIWEPFWPRAAPRWFLLQRVCLGMGLAVCGFIEFLLRDKEWRESSLLPSLTRLDLTGGMDSGAFLTLRLIDALMKRVEKGVQLETLDLRTCLATNDAVRPLCEIVVDVSAPEVRSPFVSSVNSGVEDYSDGDGDGDSDASDSDEEGEEEENYSEIEGLSTIASTSRRFWATFSGRSGVELQLCPFLFVDPDMCDVMILRSWVLR